MRGVRLRHDDELQARRNVREWVLCHAGALLRPFGGAYDWDLLEDSDRVDLGKRRMDERRFTLDLALALVQARVWDEPELMESMHAARDAVAEVRAAVAAGAMHTKAHRAHNHTIKQEQPHGGVAHEHRGQCIWAQGESAAVHIVLITSSNPPSFWYHGARRRCGVLRSTQHMPGPCSCHEVHTKCHHQVVSCKLSWSASHRGLLKRRLRGPHCIVALAAP